ncbi:MAG: sel1 repeat family protein [Verrucomicrobiales bacterium]|nr:sel1 repeat family protein [Verrucomicrobiales bacterium]
MSLRFVFRRLLLPAVLCCLCRPAAQGRFVTPDEVITEGALKSSAAVFKRSMTGEQPTKEAIKSAVEAIRKASDSGDKNGQFAYAFALHQGAAGDPPKDKPLALVEEAKTLYKKAADAGVPAAQNNLGLLKLATQEDAKQSIALIEEAATAGYGKARITMAQIYMEGTGVEKNLEQASRWLQRAEASDPEEAHYLLGLVSEASNDQPGAVANLTKAAEKNYLPAILQLGAKFMNAQATSAEAAAAGREEARKWFTKAMEAGAPVAKVNLGLIEETQGAAEKDKTKQAEFYKKALQFYQQAAASKVPDAYNKLGYFYENGLGVEKSADKAYSYYKQGADAGLPISMYNVAVMSEEGRGVKEKNESEAVKLFTDAAKRGFGPAQLALGERYRAGKTGLDRDPIAAMAWIEKSAQSGNVVAQLELGNMLESGEAGFANLEAAAKIYLELARKGQPIAMFQLADMFQKGRGLKQDLAKAYGFMTAAAKILASDEKLGKQAADRLAELKKSMSAEQVKEGEAFLKELMPSSGTAGSAEKTAEETPAKPRTDSTKPKSAGGATGAKPKPR